MPKPKVFYYNEKSKKAILAFLIIYGIYTVTLYAIKQYPGTKIESDIFPPKQCTKLIFFGYLAI